ncbi:hypothetical protein U1Q18_009196 [Sarracenia purpurea var. burkii]
MASLLLLLAEFLRHQSSDPISLLISSHPSSSSSSSFPPSSPPSVAAAATFASPSSYPANWVAKRSSRTAAGGCGNEAEDAAEDLPESGFCADLVWP